MNMDGKDNRKLIEALVQSPVFRNFERSFTEATGLAVALVPVESWHLTFCGHRKENGFCALLSACRRASAMCLETQEKLTAGATRMARTITCSAGLRETAVPVRVGDKLVGFLRTGQVFQSAPSAKEFQQLERLAKSWEIPQDGDTLRALYLKTPVVARKQYNAMAGLLDIFAEHLGVLSNQLLLQQSVINTGPTVIARARAFIEEHFAEPLSLKQVAAASFTSPFYFCKAFKRTTGLTFTAFVGRLRIEKAKNLLLNPNYRVSEIGFAVGFQSLTHFNRKFSQYVGQSPTNYRLRIQGSLAVGPAAGARIGTSRARAVINGTALSGSPIPVRPTRRTLGNEWFPSPNMARPGAGKRAAGDCAHNPRRTEFINTQPSRKRKD
jgi:AraC-like DNA-binding protein/ligand-binding sensor protein